MKAHLNLIDEVGIMKITAGILSESTKNSQIFFCFHFHLKIIQNSMRFLLFKGDIQNFIQFTVSFPYHRLNFEKRKKYIFSSPLFCSLHPCLYYICKRFCIIKISLKPYTILMSEPEIILDPIAVLQMTNYFEKHCSKSLGGATFGFIYAKQVELKFIISLTAPLGTNN